MRWHVSWSWKHKSNERRRVAAAARTLPPRRRVVTPRHEHIKGPRTQGYAEIIPTITLNEFVNYTSVDSLRNTPEGAPNKLPINKIKATRRASDVYRLTRF